MQSNDDSTNAERRRMLLAHAESAAAMMSLARISRDPETVRRNKDNALKDYQTAMNLILLTQMSHALEHYIRGQLTPIREWLEAGGLRR